MLGFVISLLWEETEPASAFPTIRLPQNIRNRVFKKKLGFSMIGTNLGYVKFYSLNDY